MPTTPLNLVLVVPGDTLPRWQYVLVQRLLKLPVLRPVLLLQGTPSSLPATHWQRGLQPLRWLDALLWYRHPARALQPLAMQGLKRLPQGHGLDAPYLQQRFQRLRVDLVINLAEQAELPDWLYLGSRYGVWQCFFEQPDRGFHPGPGVAAFARRERQWWAGVCRYARRTAQPQVMLLTSSSTDRLSLNFSVEPMLWKLAGLWPQWLAAWAAQRQPGHELARLIRCQAGRRTAVPSDVDKADAVSNRSDSLSGTLLLKLAYRMLANPVQLAGQRLWSRPRWNLLYGAGSLDRLQVLEPPSDRFWADPCLIREGERYFIFIEEWLYRERKGRIACLEWLGGERFSAPVTVLERDYHLSYPHVFRYQDNYYLIPESAENHSIELYRCERFPDRWVFVKYLMRGVQAYDATLHYHQQRWWMFVNMRPHPGASPNDLLYLFSAESPLSSHWQAHPCNPVVTEVARARPAGRILQLNGKLYRPSQNCAGSYGRGLNLNRIVEWNERCYEEQTLCHHLPEHVAGLDGMHTFSMVGDRIVSDGIGRQRHWKRVR
ncbi:MAG: hypothetical protein R3E95_17555 [Thiolinea sp.]